MARVLTHIAVLPAEVPFALALNLGLLFCVALEPYLFYLLITTQVAALVDPASIAYALDAGIMFLSLAGLAYILVKEERTRGEEKRRLHPVVLKRFNRVMKIQAVVGGIYVASALPIFWINTPIGPLRFLLWFSPFIIVTTFRKSKTQDGQVILGLRPRKEANGHELLLSHECLARERTLASSSSPFFSR